MLIKNIENAVLKFDLSGIKDLVRIAIESEADLTDIINKGLVNPLSEIGQKYSEGLYFIPEMLGAAKTVQAGMDEIKPHLLKSDSKPLGTIIIGTVKGDMHDIGKNLVAMMLEGANFKIIDLGVDVSGEQFVAEAKKHNAQMVALSVLLTTTMPAMQEIIGMVKKELPNVSIMIGGAPIDETFANKIGGIKYAEDAAKAATLAKKEFVPVLD
jgi:5-methyltetrahydrofolate--homocysteine methyltransferase